MALQNQKIKIPGYQCLFKYQNTKGQIHYYAEVIRNGTRYGQKNLTKLFNAQTPNQANNALNHIYSELDKGNDPFNIRSEKLDDLFEEHLKKLNEPTKTTQKYQYNKWIKPRIGHLKIGKIQEHHFITIMDDVDQAKLQPSTKLALKELLSPIFKREHTRKTIDSNILTSIKIKAPRKKFIIPVTLDAMENEIKKVFDAINDLPLTEGNTRALFLIALLTGRRIGELEKLVYSDVDFETGWVRPRPETTKTQKDATHLYKYKIPPIVLMLLEPLQTDEKIFTYHQSSYTKLWKKMLSDNKINPTYTAHKTRHFILSLMSKYYERNTLDEILLSHANQNSDAPYITHSDDLISQIYEKYWNHFF